MGLYSIKMRSSKTNKHISGAENIVNEERVEESVTLLVKRSINHAKGKADSINIKIEKIEANEIQFINPLPVTTVKVKDDKEGIECAEVILNKLGINKSKSSKIIELIKNVRNMRGAIILDINSFERIEPDKERGIRATYMDFEGSKLDYMSKDTKYNAHFIEALALASKVSSSPNIIGEICYSDDPNYTAGYVASKKYGYIRFPHLKKLGDERGGRIFLYDPCIDRNFSLLETIDYIENTKVLVKNDIKFNENITPTELQNI